MASPKRDHLIDTALRLFNQEGYHAVGVDRIIEEAGVARMTLYNHFKSKDELILAVLRRRDERFRNGFMRRVEKAADTPRGRLLAVFDAMDDWFRSEEFNGCMFIQAAGEFGSPDSPIYRAAREHKEMVRDYICDLAKAANAKDAEALGNGLNLLAEGAIVVAHAAGDRTAAQKAKQAAEILIRQAGL